MNHPYESNLNANEKYNKMLNYAAAYRRAQQITGKRPSLFKALFGSFSKVEQFRKGTAAPTEASPAA